MPYIYNPHTGTLDYYATASTGSEIVALLEALGEGSRLSHAKLDDVGADDHHAKYTNAEAVAQAKTVKLDDFTAPDDTTDLDATAALHGLMSKAYASKLDGIADGADVTADNETSHADVVVDGDIGSTVLAQQTIGIADDNLLEVDGSPANGNIAVFTATGINGLNEADFKTAYNMEAGVDFEAFGAIATHAAITDAHHAKYTDAEAEAVADTQIAAHAGDEDAHHTKYTDEEARTAMFAIAAVLGTL